MPLDSHTSTTPPLVDIQDHSQSAASPASHDLETAIRRYSGMVLGVCRRMLGDSDAEDAAQAVFVLFWQKGSQLRHESHVVGWLHRTAQQVCRNAGRTRAARIKHEQKVAADTAVMTSQSTDSVQWSEIREILDEEINRLPEKLRVAFLLFHCQHRPLIEIAALVGASVPTVGTWLQRARARLAAALRRRGVVAIGTTVMVALLSENVIAESASAGFVATTLQTISAASTTGLTTCSPNVVALVKAGGTQAWSLSRWISLVVGVAAIAFPVLIFWTLPALQTRRSPDFASLQGRWEEVQVEQDGAQMNVANPVAYVGILHFNGRRFHRFQTLADGRVLEAGNGTFVLDSEQNPPAIDFKLWSGTAYGVYELNGDQLLVCVTRGGDPRPADIKTRQNDNRMLSRYRRVRD